MKFVKATSRHFNACCPTNNLSPYEASIMFYNWQRIIIAHV
ncbi:unnamed protein product [Brassica oleracea]